LKQSAHILLEGAPASVDLTLLRQRILEIPGIEEVHDFHVWTLTSRVHSASVHLAMAADAPRGQLAEAVRKLLKDEAGIDHATIQAEEPGKTGCEATAGHT
jgi:cobalt-zinc-cadmium efflux system protein